MTRKLGRLLFASILLGLSLPCAAVEVSNVRSGLACKDPSLEKVGGGWICHVTQDILVTDQGRCTYDGKDQPCTWIGFEFDYAEAGAGAKLQCVAETSEPIRPGNPETQLADVVTSEQFELDLAGDSGHFFNPMYWVFDTRTSDQTITASYTCKSGDRLLLQARFDLHFPAPPK